MNEASMLELWRTHRRRFAGGLCLMHRGVHLWWESGSEEAMEELAMTQPARLRKIDCPHPKWARQDTPAKTATYCGICGGDLRDA